MFPTYKWVREAASCTRPQMGAIALKRLARSTPRRSTANMLYPHFKAIGFSEDDDNAQRFVLMRWYRNDRGVEFIVRNSRIL